MSRRVRTREPERNQVAIRFEAPEDVLPADHRARVLWHLLGQLDLSPLLAEAAMSLSSVSVIGNALRLRNAPIDHD